LRYEHLYRIDIDGLPALAREAEAHRYVFNHIRPHEALGGRRPIEVYTDPSLNHSGRVS
jgi:putative transposase